MVKWRFTTSTRSRWRKLHNCHSVTGSFARKAKNPFNRADYWVNGKRTLQRGGGGGSFLVKTMSSRSTLAELAM